MTRFLLLLALALAAPALHAGTLSEQWAEAHALQGQALLYREQHLLRSEGAVPRERLVLYRCADGRAFARKRLDYGPSALAPSFALEDARSGYAEGLRRLAGRAQLWFRARRAQPERAAWLDPPPQVVDAGFDEFIRAHWAALLEGKPQPIAFAVPSRLRAMRFEVQRLRAAQLHGEPAQLFRLRLDGWLGLIAPHIDVAYGARSRRLLRFEGLGNLRDARGEDQLSVRIDFPAPPGAAAPATWEQALSETLVGRCGSGQAPDK